MFISSVAVNPVALSSWSAGHMVLQPTFSLGNEGPLSPCQGSQVQPPTGLAPQSTMINSATTPVPCKAGVCLSSGTEGHQNYFWMTSKGLKVLEEFRVFNF